MTEPRATAQSLDSNIVVLSRADAAWSALIAALLGVFILFGVGLAAPTAIHNAAHDGRHAFAFPCH